MTILKKNICKRYKIEGCNYDTQMDIIIQGLSSKDVSIQTESLHQLQQIPINVSTEYEWIQIISTLLEAGADKTHQPATRERRA
jgi:maltoporin